MEIKTAAIIYFIVAVISIFLIFSSGISKDHVLYPMSSGSSLFDSDSSDISLTLIILFVLVFPLSYSAVSVYSISSKDPDIMMLAVPLAASIFVFILGGINVSSLLISLGLVVSVFMTLYLSAKEVEYYKKINPSRITSNSTSSAIRIFTIFLLISAYLVIPSEPDDVEDIIRSDLDSCISLIMPENSLSSMGEQNKELIYRFIETTETSLLNSMQSGMETDLTPEQSKLCVSAMKNNMDVIDRNTKALIDMQFESQLESLSGTSMIPDSMVASFIILYPAIVLMTVFFAAEFFRVFIAYLSGLYASFMYRETPEEKKPVQRQQPSMSVNRPSPSHYPDDPYYSNISNGGNGYYFDESNRYRA